MTKKEKDQITEEGFTLLLRGGSFQDWEAMAKRKGLYSADIGKATFQLSKRLNERFGGAVYAALLEGQSLPDLAPLHAELQDNIVSRQTDAARRELIKKMVSAPQGLTTVQELKATFPQDFLREEDYEHALARAKKRKDVNAADLNAAGLGTFNYGVGMIIIGVILLLFSPFGGFGFIGGGIFLLARHESSRKHIKLEQERKDRKRRAEKLRE